MNLLLLLLGLGSVVIAFDPIRFPGPYCATRTPEKCCRGRQDECTVPIHDTLCYCDEFCYQHSVKDCCPDYKPVCLNVPRTTKPPTPLDSECKWQRKTYQPGDTYKSECNECVCTKEVGPFSKVKNIWKCSNDACINEQKLIDNINRNYYSWKAASYSKFDGIKLRDGIKYFLGTNYPKLDVTKLHPISIHANQQFPRDFDSRSEWNSYIHEAMDQGQCASSWAFSTVSMVADRWAIQTKGVFNTQLSVQQILDCNRYVTACAGGRVEDAWWWLQREGVTQERCYPYISGITQSKGRCRDSSSIRCDDGEQPHIYKTTPPYRISRNEKDIMYEILTQGPVQAIMEVRADLFLYKSGIYKYTREPEYETNSNRNHTMMGIHSVKIIGWGEENGIRYWRAVNSWGSQWGEGGTFRILRGENESKIEDFVVGVWVRVEQDKLKYEKSYRHSHRHRH